MDAPKDNSFEYKMAQQFKKLKNKRKKILIIDDILFVNMIDFWSKIKSPKLMLVLLAIFQAQVWLILAKVFYMIKSYKLMSLMKSI